MKDRVPYVDLAAQNQALEEELLEAVRGVLRHGHYILGPEVSAFEQQVADFLDVPHVIGVNSGTDALVLALRALDIGPGDEVITVAHTYFATASAILLVGATPVFIDIDEETMLMDPELIEPAITPNTRAVIPVHLNGYPCDMTPIAQVCQEHGLALIEDTAQALGASYKGRMAGTFGVGCFSLHPLKVLGALGDAGMIAVSDDALAAKLRQLRTIGHRDRDHVIWVSGNSRLDTLHAAMLSVKFKHLPRYIQARRNHADAYTTGLPDTLTLPPRHEDRQGIHCPFVVRHEARDELLKQLVAAGVDAKVHYPIPTHRQEAFAHLPPRSLPVTDRVVSSILSLPSSPELSEDGRARVIETFSNLL